MKNKTYINAREHYDLMIDENNDPVHDIEELKTYMNNWDGDSFIEMLNLDKKKEVLEIGIGTGRIALRVASFCKKLYGIDISFKTIERAKKNLSSLNNVIYINDDFLKYEFGIKFDVIYSSLTFMHIKNKKKAIKKISSLLKSNGRFVLSIDKNQSKFIDYGTRRVKVYPDKLYKIEKLLKEANLNLMDISETSNAFIILSEK